MWLNQMLPEWEIIWNSLGEITWNSLVDVNKVVTASKERRLTGLMIVNIFNIGKVFSGEIQIENV